VQDPSAQSGPCRLNQVAVGHVAQESVVGGPGDGPYVIDSVCIYIAKHSIFQ
jgi:hypothetical protein